MKNLILFVLLIVSGALFFHDKQQTADLAKAQEENAQLTTQLSNYQSSFAELQARDRQLTAQISAQPAAPAYHAVQTQPQGFGSSEANPLDRPAYKDH